MYNYELSSPEKADHRVRLYKKECRKQKRYFYFKRKVTIIKAELIRAGNMESRKINTVIPIKEENDYD